MCLRVSVRKLILRDHLPLFLFKIYAPLNLNIDAFGFSLIQKIIDEEGKGNKG